MSEELSEVKTFLKENYEDPIFSAERSDISGYECRARITAPIGTYVMFMWNDEECFFSRVKSPEKAIAS